MMHCAAILMVLLFASVSDCQLSTTEALHTPAKPSNTTKVAPVTTELSTATSPSISATSTISTASSSSSPSVASKTVTPTHSKIPISSTVQSSNSTAEWATSSTTEAPVNATCTALKACYNDDDCYGEEKKGRCIGAFVAKCNCNACINFWPCTSDVECGGLQSACDVEKGLCKCIEAYKKHGYTLFIDALRNLCNVKECSEGTEACHGLPCNTGRCFC